MPPLRGHPVSAHDPYTRLTEFREHHPSVVIGRDDFGNWQALIPRQGGETFLGGRKMLRTLLDDLDEVITEDPMSSG